MWGVFVVYKNQRKYKKFKTEEEAVQYYNMLKDKLKEKYKKEFKKMKIGVVSLSKAYKPDNNKKKVHGKMWCPYCREYRTYKFDGSYKRCELCGISDNDFYVKVYNGIWPNAVIEVSEDKKKRLRRSRRV